MQTEAKYVSLVNEFINYYIRVEVGEGAQFTDELALRLHLNKNYRKWWCGVYDEPYYINIPNEPWFLDGLHNPKLITFEELDAQIIERGLQAETEKSNLIWQENFSAQG